MADEIYSQTEYSQTDTTKNLNESVGKGFEVTGKVMERRIVHTERKLSKAEKTNAHLKGQDFMYAMNDSVDKHIKSRKVTFLETEKEDRLKELKNIQKKRNLTGSEANELRGLEREKAKAKAGAKAEKNRQKAITARGKLPEYEVKTGAFGNRKLDLTDEAKKRNRMLILRDKKAKGFLTAFEEKELKTLEKTIGKADRKKANKQKNRNKNSAVKSLSKQAGAFADEILKGDGDNVGTEAVLATKKGIKGTYDFLTGTTKGIKEGVKLSKTKKEIKDRKKALLAEKKQFKAEVNYLYENSPDDTNIRKALFGDKEQNEPIEKKSTKEKQKAAQKKQIKKQYAAELRAKEGIHGVGGAAKKESLKQKIARKKQEAVASIKRKLMMYIIAALVVLALFSVVILICAIGGGTSVTGEATYNVERTDIEAAEEYVNSLELALDEEIQNIETDYPDYDEYNYNLAEIGHNAFDLSNYLAAKNREDGFTFESIKGDLDSLFEDMYELTLTPRQETRTRPGTCDCEDCRSTCGDDCDCTDPEEYTVDILDVVLTKKELSSIASDSLDSKQMEFYNLYRDSGGLMQIFSSPLDMDWLNSIGRNYGSSKNPSTGVIEDHKGIDINVSSGTNVYATVFSGTVTAVGYDEAFGNYVSIKKESGEVIKFAHLSSVSVSVGNDVGIKTVIGQTGSTGTECNGMEQLHIETYDKNGACINPTFAMSTQFGTLREHLIDRSSGSFGGYGGSSGGKTRVEMGLPTTYSNGDVEGLIAFAEKFCGMEYVWGGSKPSEGFDCSGFVTYCVRESGFYPMYRTSAQGIYQTYCTPVSASEAQPGDLIFFKGTSNKTGNTITHVGIYCGDGVMLHCGDPIKYTNINTAYWTQHFYGYGHIGL